MVLLVCQGVSCRSAPPTTANSGEIVPISSILRAPPPPQEETVQEMLSLPRVDPLTMTMSPSYSYGYTFSDKVGCQMS